MSDQLFTSQATPSQAEAIQEENREPFYADRFLEVCHEFTDIPNYLVSHLQSITDAARAIQSISVLQEYFEVERIAFEDGNPATQITPFAAESLKKAVGCLGGFIAQEVHTLGKQMAFRESLEKSKAKGVAQ